MPPRVRTAAASALLGGLAALTGCVADGMPPAGVVQGKVTYKGQPVTAGNVIFYPAGGAGRDGAGLIGADGSYTVFDAPLGDTKVVVRPGDPRAPGQSYPGKTLPKGAVVKDAPPEVRAGGAPGAKPAALPVKYARAESTPLAFTVKRGDNRFDIELAD